MGIRISIVGNCQSRPLAHLMASMVHGLVVESIAVVHTLSDSDEFKFNAAFETSDFIIAQRVTENYPCRFVRTNVLKNMYGAKVLVWPNLYYTGYNPDLFYLRSISKTPVGGPLGDYHIKTIFNTWSKGESASSALRSLIDVDLNKELFKSVANDSMNDFINREAETDIDISGWLANNLFNTRCFFTFNHPTLYLLIEMARRIANKLNLLYANMPSTHAMNEPLGQYRLPVNCYISQHYKPTFDQIPFRGRVVTNYSNVSYGDFKDYQVADLVDAYFNVYDSQDKLGRL